MPAPKDNGRGPAAPGRGGRSPNPAAAGGGSRRPAGGGSAGNVKPRPGPAEPARKPDKPSGATTGDKPDKDTAAAGGKQPGEDAVKPDKPTEPAKGNGRGRKGNDAAKENGAGRAGRGGARAAKAALTPAQVFASPRFFIRTFKWSSSNSYVEGQSILSQTLQSKVLSAAQATAGDVTMAALRKMIPEMSRLTQLHKFCTFSGTVIGDEGIRLDDYLNMEVQASPSTGSVPSVRVYFISTATDKKPNLDAVAAAKPAIDLTLPEKERATAAERISKPLESMVDSYQQPSRWGMIAEDLDAGSLTEAQWARVLRNCSVFYGWIIDPKTQRITRAPKAAFRMRKPAWSEGATGVPDVVKESQDSYDDNTAGNYSGENSNENGETTGGTTGGTAGGTTGETTETGTTGEKVPDNTANSGQPSNVNPYGTPWPQQPHIPGPGMYGSLWQAGGGQYGALRGNQAGNWHNIQYASWQVSPQAPWQRNQYGAWNGAGNGAAYHAPYGNAYGGAYGAAYGAPNGGAYGTGYGMPYGGGAYGAGYGGAYPPNQQMHGGTGNRVYSTAAVPQTRMLAFAEGPTANDDGYAEPTSDDETAEGGGQAVDDGNYDNEGAVDDGPTGDDLEGNGEDGASGGAAGEGNTTDPGTNDDRTDPNTTPPNDGGENGGQPKPLTPVERARREKEAAEARDKVELDRLRKAGDEAALNKKLEEQQAAEEAAIRKKYEDEQAADAAQGIIRNPQALYIDHPVMSSWKPADSIPNYRVNDDSKIVVTVCKHELMESFAKNDFSSQATEASISGGYGGITAGVSGGHASSQSKTFKGWTAERKQTMVASYQFPRCDVVLYPGDLEPTDEFAELLELIRTDKHIEDLRRLQSEFGQLFCQNLTLGGRLMATKVMQSSEKDNTQMEEEQFKDSVGVQVNTPYGGASVKHESTKGKSEEKGKTQIDATENNVFEAVGGDTILASNPTEWALTVGNYQNWRVIQRDGLSRIADMLIQMSGYKQVYSWFIQALPVVQKYVILNSDHAVTARLKITAPTANLSMLNKGDIHYYLSHGATDTVTPRMNGLNLDDPWMRIDVPSGKVLFNPATWRAPVIQGFPDYGVGEHGQYGSSYNKEFAAVTWEIIAPFSDVLTRDTRVILRTKPWKDPSLVLEPGKSDTSPTISHLVVFRNAQGHFVPAMSDRDEHQYWRLMIPADAPGDALHTGDRVELCWSFKDQTTGYRDYQDDAFGRRRLDKPPELDSDVLFLKVPFPRFENLGTSTAMIMSTKQVSSNQPQHLRVRDDAPSQALCGGDTGISPGFLFTWDWHRAVHEQPPDGAGEKNHQYVLQDVAFRFDLVDNRGYGDAQDYLLRGVDQGTDDPPPRPPQPAPPQDLLSSITNPLHIAEKTAENLGLPFVALPLAGAEEVINFGVEVGNAAKTVFGGLSSLF